MGIADDEPPSDRRRRRLLRLVAELDEVQTSGANVFNPWKAAADWLAWLDGTGDGAFLRELHAMDDAFQGPKMASPWLQMEAARRCLDLRPAIEAGKGSAVLEGVAACAAHGLVVPGWLAASFVFRWERVHLGEVPTWEDPDAFGPSREAGVNAGGEEARNLYGPWAYELACRLLEENPSIAIALDKLYADVGAVVGRSAQGVYGLIRAHIAVWPAMTPPLQFIKRHCSEGGSLLSAHRQWFRQETGSEAPDDLKFWEPLR